MKRIFVSSIKGGVGKSTIANEIAYSLDRTKTPYSYFDLDGQGGSGHQESLSEEAIVQIADTPAAASREDLEKWAQAADLVVIPTRTGVFEADAFIDTLNAIEEAHPGIPIIIVQNGWNRYKAAREFTRWLEKNTGRRIYTLPQAEGFIQAAASKQSIIDYSPKSAGARAMKTIVNAVRETADLKKES